VAPAPTPTQEACTVTVLYVVRHAIAEQRDQQRWPDDALRPLTSKGEASFRRAARGLAHIVPTVDVVLSSGYLRAWKTAEILHEEADWPAPQACPGLEPERPAADSVAAVDAQPGRDSVAIVGHEPCLSNLVSLLLGAPEGAFELKKGGVVCVERNGGHAVLRWALPPKTLRALSRR